MTDRPRDEDSQLNAEEEQFSNDHPLASPNELAGDAQSGIDLEFAARDVLDAQGAEPSLTADAEGAATGMDLDSEEEEVDTLPLEGN